MKPEPVKDTNVPSGPLVGFSVMAGVSDGEVGPVASNVASLTLLPVAVSWTQTSYGPGKTLLGTVNDAVMVPVPVAVVVATVAPTIKICTWPFGVKPEPVTDTNVPSGPLVGLNVIDGAAFATGVIIGATANVIRKMSASVAKLNSFLVGEKRFLGNTFQAAEYRVSFSLGIRFLIETAKEKRRFGRAT